jgi:peptide/nickel transport system ATP-binding protein
MDNQLEIHDLCVPLPKGGDRGFALEKVSFALPRGQLMCVVGESGSGKSTLARAIMGLLELQKLPPASGQILLDGEDLLQVTGARLNELRGNAMSMIFQEPMSAMNPLMRVGVQADEVLRFHGVRSARERKQRILQSFAEVHLPNPEEIYDRYPHRLSGGQRQRVMIAMALLLGPKLLIADEPTTALDVTTQMRILHLLKGLQQEKQMSMLFVTHDFGVVAEIADTVLVMREGRIVEAGTKISVLRSPRHEYTRSLLRDLKDNAVNTRPQVARSAILSVKGLTKSYSTKSWLSLQRSKRTVLENFEMELMPSETIAIVGESGSGKSTVARCITRLTDADKGSIVIAGEDFREIPRKKLRASRSRIQMIFQDPFSSLNPRSTAGRAVSEAAIAHGVPKSEALENGRRLLEIVGLDPSAFSRLPHEFSGGQRQRIGIARALSVDPSIIIADEAVSALDVSTQTQIIKLFEDLQDRFGIAIIFITHDLRLARKIADKVIVMQSGKIVEQGKVKDVLEHPQHPYTKELLASVPGLTWLESPPDACRSPQADGGLACGRQTGAGL